MQRFKITVLLLIVIFLSIAVNVIKESNAYKNSALHFGLAYIGLFFIAFVGYAGWRVLKQKWVAKIWLVSYMFVLVIVFIIRAASYFTSMLPFTFSLFANKLNSVFISPLPVMVVYILIVVFKQKPLVQDERMKV